MINNRQVLRQDDGYRTSHAVRDWLRRQLLGDAGISLDRRSLLLGVIFFVSIVVAAILAVILGFGTAAILAALSAMCVLIAAVGGPLRSDLRMLAWFGPCFILSVAGVRLLTTVSPWAAIPVIVVIVFITGLLPAFSSRYTTVGTALALGMLIGFGLRLQGTLPVLSIFGGIASGVIIAVLMRCILGVGDPDLITRKVIARVLIDADLGAIDNAWTTLHAVRPRQWMGDALSGAEGYRVACLILNSWLEHVSHGDALRLRSILDEADKEARELAGLLASKQTSTRTAPTQNGERETADGLSTELQETIASLWSSLEKVRSAALRKEMASVTLSKLPGASFSDTCRALFSWNSSNLRHALRCAFVILVALIIATLNWGNPLNTTFLTATFAIMHPTLLGTASKALQRTAGAIFGVCLAGGLALILPSSVLLPLAIFALFVAFPFMSKNLTIYYAMLAVMTLLAAISTKSISLSAGLLEYLLYIIIAAVIALFFIFVVPSRIEPNVEKRTLKAMATVRTLLLSVRSTLNSGQGNANRIRNDYILAARSVQNLLATTNQLTKESLQRRDLTVQIANALEKLLADVSALEFQHIAQRDLAAELSTSEQLLNLDNLNNEFDMAQVKRSTQSESGLLQNLLMIHALAARHGAKQLLLSATL